MKASGCFTIFCLISTLGVFRPAQAESTPFAEYDELVFTAYSEVRGVRWLLHRDFTDSRDQRTLLRETDALVLELREIEQSLYEERSVATIDRQVDASLRRVALIKRLLRESDFASVQPAHHSRMLEGVGFQLIPEAAHPGRKHVDRALGALHRAEQSLDQLHLALLGGAGSLSDRFWTAPSVRSSAALESPNR